MKRAQEALGDDPTGQYAEIHARLTGGQQDVETMAEHASRLAATLRQLDGEGPSVEARIAEVDRQIAEATDDRLSKVYTSNRALLVARLGKIQSLRAELERVHARAEGFVLAAENVHLDAARLGAGMLEAMSDALTSPLESVAEEVEILRQVEAELEAL